MNVKEFLKKTTKKGAKAGGSLLIKSALDPKTWLVVYMAVLVSKAYNRFGQILDREAELNQAAATKLEQMTATLEGMQRVCEIYQLTPEQVREAIKIQKELSTAELAVVKTAHDSKKSWRDWLPGAKNLRETGLQNGTDLEVPGQAAMLLDAYENAEQEQTTKAAAQKASQARRN